MTFKPKFRSKSFKVIILNQKVILLALRFSKRIEDHISKESTVEPWHSSSLFVLLFRRIRSWDSCLMLAKLDR